MDEQVILLSIAWKDMVYPPQWNSERTEVLRDDAPVIIANWYLCAFMLSCVLSASLHSPTILPLTAQSFCSSWSCL